MGKKDFSDSTENVFDDFFTQPSQVKKKEIVKEFKTKPADEKKEVTATPKKAKAPKQSEVIKEEIPKVEEKPKELKSYNKDCRFNFYLDTELVDFVSNHLWLTRQKNYSQYFNKLIRENLLEILELPADTTRDELIKEWENYKKKNNF